MDYCVMEQKWLRDPGVIPCSGYNLPAIRDPADRAAMIVLGFGTVHPYLEHYADAVCQALVDDRRSLWCLKPTKNGNVGHPLYIAGGTKPLLPHPQCQGCCDLGGRRGLPD